ncbi:hypothetical protein BN2475_160027 [Paraburkholderia ribeironis]|uniref:Uncharacterized protein n=1 Tax=Paraburkholderia ribeironis TaxID=1247936 RepID=A0A1N7RU68_9BURK|nr:hypothetical protein [Paraburkholderia ribeironis]SIT38647.1 hypothetical protein BN2475_160027 [Paraburkholderia ribeironis]
MANILEGTAQNHASAWIKAGLESGSIKLQGPANGGEPAGKGKEGAEYLATLFEEVVTRMTGKTSGR